MRNETSIRSHDGQALDLDQVRRYVPSLFATEKHESRSERYVFIPSIDMLTALDKEGFKLVEARQSITRDPSRKSHAKHMMRFRSTALAPAAERNVGDVHFEVVLRNGHDGTSAYDFMAGLFRLVCKNGMVVPDGVVDSVHVRHSGNAQKIIGQVIEGAYTVLEKGKTVIEAPQKWAQIALQPEEQHALADAVRTIRFGDAEGKVASPITAAQLLAPRRSADTGNDLWKTFNRLQENAIRGGLSGIGRDSQNRVRRSTTREVRGIDSDVKLNRAMWTLAERMAELKGA